MREQLSRETHTAPGYDCLPHYQDSASQPIVAQLERASRFSRDDTIETKLEKLETQPALAIEDRGAVTTFFADLQSKPTLGFYPKPELALQQHKQMLLDALES